MAFEQEFSHFALCGAIIRQTRTGPFGALHFGLKLTTLTLTENHQAVFTYACCEIMLKKMIVFIERILILMYSAINSIVYIS